MTRVRYLCLVCREIQTRLVKGTPRRRWFLPCCRNRHTPHHIFENRPITGRWA